MQPFDYVMTLVSIVVGLGITHVLSAFGMAVHRLRGHGEPLRLEPVYLLWVSFGLTWLVAFWWWEFKLADLPIEWTFGLYLFLIGYAIALFMMLVILVPTGMEGVRDSYAYFLSARHWFLSVVLLCIGLDQADSWIKSADYALRPVYMVQQGVLAGLCVLAMLSTRRSVQLPVAIAAFGYQLVYVWQELGILGRW